MNATAGNRRIALLGPQREHPSVHDAVETLAPAGRVATVTAGWEEREAEDQELIDHLGRETVNLELFPRTEEIFERDPELFGAMQERNGPPCGATESYTRSGWRPPSRSRDS